VEVIGPIRRPARVVAVVAGGNASASRSLVSFVAHGRLIGQYRAVLPRGLRRISGGRACDSPRAGTIDLHQLRRWLIAGVG
jgi:hypothetical protein